MTHDLDSYDRFAEIYDRLWAERACQRFLPIVSQTVLRTLAPGATVLDLCCGTGAMSRALQARGLKPIGVDGAAGMIAVAKRRAPELQFVTQPCTELRLPLKCQAALCLYDSLNHLRSVEELELTLRNVYQTLDSGPLLFDLNGLEGYRARWRGSFDVVEEDLVVAVRSSFDESRRVGQMKLTAFTPAHGSWSRTDLSFQQRLYDTSQVLAVLEKVGFRAARAFDAEADFGMAGEVGRVIFLCERDS